MLPPACPGDLCCWPPEDVRDASSAVSFILEPRNSRAPPKAHAAQFSWPNNGAYSPYTSGRKTTLHFSPTEGCDSREQNSLALVETLSDSQFCLSHLIRALPTQGFCQQCQWGINQWEQSACLQPPTLSADVDVYACIPQAGRSP